ncbi:MAG: hypothetical protein J7L03_00550 [Caldisericaceae bacterium]|nr:hypothetical protein [Caldisericaceae bacterium]
MKNKIIAVVVSVFLVLPLLFVPGIARAEVPVPTNFEAYGYGNYINIQWEYPSSAKKKNLTFEVFEYNSGTKKWTSLGEIPNLQASIQNASPGKHVYKVRAKYEGTGIMPTVYSKFSNEDPGYMLSKPTGLKVSISKFTSPFAKGSPGVTIKWDSITDQWATHVGIYRKKTGENDFHLIGKPKKSSKSFIDITAQSNTEYAYGILLMRKETGKKSDYSPLEEQNGTILTYPDPPKNFKAVGKGNDVVLTWNRQANCDNIAVYEKTSSGILGWKLVKQMSNMVVKLTIKNKTPGKYTYLVAAFNKSGNSPNAPTQTAYVLKKPTGVKAEGYSAQEIRIRYNTPDTNANKIKIYWSTDNKKFSLIGSISTSSSFIKVTGLEPDTKRYFKISFTRGENESPLSDVVSAKTKAEITVPNAPSNFTAILSNSNTVILKWKDNANNERGFIVERKTKNGNYEKIATLYTETCNMMYTDSSVQPGTTYYYRAKAFNEKGNSDYSNEVSITTKSQATKRIEIKLQPDNEMMLVNGAQQEIDPGRGTKPVIIPKWGRTVVPIRAIVEALGGTIEWDGVARKVTIKFNGNIIELWIDNPKARVNGQPKWIDENNHDVKPIIVNSRTMLPLRFVTENLGCNVDWDPKTRTITITYPAS